MTSYIENRKKTTFKVEIFSYFFYTLPLVTKSIHIGTSSRVDTIKVLKTKSRASHKYKDKQIQLYLLEQYRTFHIPEKKCHVCLRYHVCVFSISGENKVDYCK